MASAPDRGRTPLMFIHGAWLAANSWDTFANYFEERGFAVSAPEWPRKQGSVDELREGTEEIKASAWKRSSTRTRRRSAHSTSRRS